MMMDNALENRPGLFIMNLIWKESRLRLAFEVGALVDG